MKKSILHGAIGYRAYLHGSRLPLFTYRQPTAYDFVLEKNPNSREIQVVSMTPRFAEDDRTPWQDSDGATKGEVTGKLPMVTSPKLRRG